MIKGAKGIAQEKENDVCINTQADNTCAKEFVHSDSKQDWKALYYEMLALKNEADNDLKEMLKLHSESEAKMATLLEAHGFPIASKTSTQKVQDEFEKTKRALQFYQLITGMTVESVGDKKFQCTIKHDKQPADTTFIIGETEEEMTYEITGNAEVLPEYMQRNLTFDKSLTPVILADALHAIYVEDEEEEEEA